MRPIKKVSIIHGRKKKIVINEIKYWKQNQLLPDVYCNFLLSLYSEGKEREAETHSRRAFSFLQSLSFYTLALTLLVLTFVIIYFTQFSFAMQIALVTFFFLVSLSVTIFLFKKGKHIVHVYTVNTAVISFLLIIRVNESLFTNDPILMAGTISLICLSWIFTGYRWKFQYLTAAGAAGILILLIFLMI